MLQSVSWQDFLLCSALLAVVWYTGLYFLYFRKKNGVSAGKAPAVPTKLSVGTAAEPPAPWVMGEPKLPEGLDLVGSADFVFQGAAKVKQLGLVADVLEEIKEVFEVLKKNDGSKADLFGMMDMVMAKYPELADHPNLEQLRDFIEAQAPFALTEAELESFWS